MLGLLRLLLRVLHVIIPPEVDSIKMRVIGGSKHWSNLFKLGVTSVILCDFENYILAVNAVLS
jgi:hypothetical protein